MGRDLGHRVYTKYCVQQKQQNQVVEKLRNIYNAYTDLLAKDTKVTRGIISLHVSSCEGTLYVGKPSC